MITFRKLGKLGRFGNQLFQYSGTRLYGHLNGFKVGFPSWKGQNIFKLPSSPLPSRSLVFPTIQLDDLRSTSWPERLLRPIGLWKRSSIEELYRKPQDNIDLYGYLQDRTSLGLLAAQKPLVLEWLRLKPEIKEMFDRIAAEHGPYVGIHIRFGDFVKRSKSISPEMYKEVLAKVRNGRNVYIASDSPKALQEFKELSLLPLPPVPDLPADLIDFLMLMHADTVIAGGSTFSWWAAYLGNKNDYWSARLTHEWDASYEPTLEKVTI